MKDEDSLARLLFLCRYRSRRTAKREIREAGGLGTAAELDALLRAIEESPDRRRIEHLADELGAAWLAAEASPKTSDVPPAQGKGHDEWMIGEGIESRRMYVIHIGDFAGTDAWFIGEIFDSIEDAPFDCEIYKLDEGQVLGNVKWLYPTPSERVRFDLFEIAREKLRDYDIRQERDLEE